MNRMSIYDEDEDWCLSIDVFGIHRGLYSAPTHSMSLIMSNGERDPLHMFSICSLYLYFIFSVFVLQLFCVFVFYIQCICVHILIICTPCPSLCLMEREPHYICFQYLCWNFFLHMYLYFYVFVFLCICVDILIIWILHDITLYYIVFPQTQCPSLRLMERERHYIFMFFYSLYFIFHVLYLLIICDSHTE